VTQQETKKQHYLPFTYLKYFRIDQNVADRKNATIFRDDGSSVTLELVANQCYKKWFYRKEATKESEKGFQIYEADWHETVENMRAGENENVTIFLQLIMYHFRNLSIQHLGEMERYEAVITAVKNWIEQKVLKLPKGVNFTDDASHIHNFPWDVKIIKMNSPLLTSDNQAVMTIPPTKNGYGPFFLPISPNELLVAIDKTKYNFQSLEGGEEDSILANSFVAAQGLRHVYYHEEMPSVLRVNLWDMINRNKQSQDSRGKFENKGFIPGHSIFGTQERQKFTFLIPC